jgi:ATP-dependent DNA helicase RecQ
VIFHDATLLAMLRERPHTHDQLAAISGVGERKLERYGDAFLGCSRNRSRKICCPNSYIHAFYGLI